MRPLDWVFVGLSLFLFVEALINDWKIRQLTESIEDMLLYLECER